MTSGKGGTGKTSSTAAISSCLAAIGHRTLCIDGDAGLRNLDIALGMTDYTVADFADVIDGAIALEDACHEHPDIPNLFFLSAPVFRGAPDIEPAAMIRLCDDAREKFDYCLIDSPAGVGAGFRLSVCGADAAVVVATGDPMSVRAAHRVATILCETGTAEVLLLVNRVQPRRFTRLNTNIDDMIDAVGARLLAVVFEDEAVAVSGASGIPLVLYGDTRAARQFLGAARRLAGERLALRRAWRY
jgi:septum site-determining protein MinD